MGISEHNFVTRAVFALCMAAMLLCSLPHHHHGDSEAVCFDITHCFHDERGCCEHDRCPAHSSDEPASCHLKIDVAELVSLNTKHFVPVQPVIFLFVQQEPAECGEATLSLADQNVCTSHFPPVPKRRITDYIARALPARASTES